MSRDHHRARSHRSRNGEGGQHPPGQERPAQCAERDGGEQQNRGYSCRLAERAGAERFRLFLLQPPSCCLTPFINRATIVSRRRNRWSRCAPVPSQYPAVVRAQVDRRLSGECPRQYSHRTAGFVLVWPLLCRQSDILSGYSASFGRHSLRTGAVRRLQLYRSDPVAAQSHAAASCGADPLLGDRLVIRARRARFWGEKR
jgi:hypothetical protein